MKEMSNAQLQEAKIAWQTACSTIEDLFDLRPHEEMPDIRVSTSDSGLSPTTPGFIDKGSIVINTAIPQYEIVLSSTIVKLCLESVLPADLLCRECIDDLSFEFARRLTTNKVARDQWVEIWKKHSPLQRITNVTTYFPYESYNWLYSVAGNNGLDTFIHELTQRVKNHIPLSFEDYTQYISLRIQRFTNTLSATELKLAKEMIEKPDLPLKDISKITGISEEWISRKLTQLQKRMILRKFEWAPFSRIGIDMLQVLISKRDAKVDAFNLIKDCPFLYGYWRIIAGDWIGQATLMVPENRENFQYVRRGLKIISDAGFNIELHQTYSAGISHCFDYYRPKLGRWDIPWELLAIHLQRIQEDGLASTIPRVDRPKNRVGIELDELDMKIIDCVWRRMNSVSKIRAELRIGQHRVAEKLRRLRESGLITKSWEIYNVGLSEHGIIYCTEKDLGESIAAWSLRLPMSRINYSEDEKLFVIVDLPEGGSFGLATAMARLGDKVSIGFLSHRIYGSSGFPGTLWDAKYQRWICPRERLEAWISEIE